MSQDFDRDRIAQATGDRDATNNQILWGFKVLKKMVGADEVHKAEMAALVQTMREYGSSSAMIEAVEAFDITTVSLDELLQVESAGHGMKRLIYAAVLVSWADGKYSPEERAAVQKVAQYYKISESTVSAIENMVLLEQQQTALRWALLCD